MTTTVEEQPSTTSDADDAPVEPNKHEVLTWQLTNMTYIQRKAVNDALLEYANLVERCRMLEGTNKALTEDVAKLTLQKQAGDWQPPVTQEQWHEVAQRQVARSARAKRDRKPKLSVRAKP